MNRVVLIVAVVVLIAAIVITLAVDRRGRRAAVRTRPATTETVEPAPRYRESPLLQDRVRHGQLPPVEERLPDQPMVVEPVEGIGRYQSESAPGSP